MTGPCSGANVGVPKAGTAALTYIGPGAIGGALASLSGWAGAAVGAALGTITYELATFCPAGPAAQPTFTVNDIAALLNPVVTPDKIAASAKFRDFLSAVFWPLLCECSGGSVVAAAPASYPSSAPGALNVYATGSPCRVATPTPGACWSSAGSSPYPAQEVPGTGAFSLLSGSVTAVRVTTTTAICTGSGGTNRTFISYSDATGSTVRNDFGITQSVGTTTVLDSVPPGNAVSFSVGGQIVGTGTIKYDGSHVDRYCNGAVPGGPANPCCPPDPSLQAQLDAIYNLVTLIQRQSVPFAYVLGTSHTALSGAGVLSIQGLLGVKTTVTTLPSSYGVEGTSPGEHFDLGWITFGTADGYPQSIRLERTTQFSTPPRASLFTTLAYDLAPGVVVTITEINREP